MQCHMAFDIKIEFLRLCQCCVRETVRIALVITALNDLEVNLGDILNDYVQAPVTKKVQLLWVQKLVRMPEKVIVRALYGLKSAGTAFRCHLAKCIESLGYQSCKTDLDLWLIPEIKPEDGV